MTRTKRRKNDKIFHVHTNAIFEIKVDDDNCRHHNQIVCLRSEQNSSNSDLFKDTSVDCRDDAFFPFQYSKVRFTFT